MTLGAGGAPAVHLIWYGAWNDTDKVAIREFIRALGELFFGGRRGGRRAAAGCLHIFWPAGRVLRAALAPRLLCFRGTIFFFYSHSLIIPPLLAPPLSSPGPPLSSLGPPTYRRQLGHPRGADDVRQHDAGRVRRARAAPGRRVQLRDADQGQRADRRRRRGPCLGAGHQRRHRAVDERRLPAAHGRRGRPGRGLLQQLLRQERLQLGVAANLRLGCARPCPPARPFPASPPLYTECVLRAPGSRPASGRTLA